MHYANGREAKNGDKVVRFDSNGSIQVGFLYGATAGNDYCNGYLAPIQQSNIYVNLKEALHFDDVNEAIKDLLNPPKTEQAS